MEYFVDANVSVTGNGTKNAPFKTINEAAAIACSGDVVKVLPGIYRENVNPAKGGNIDKPIHYISVKDKAAVITGADRADNWEHYDGNVWKLVILPEYFKERNPFITLIAGDWYIVASAAHTGDVYIDSKSMYEVNSLNEVMNPVKSTISWDKDFSVYTWYTTQENNNTVIYANFNGRNPNVENVEISARKSCFYPEEEGCNYITLTGFTIRQAATQWAPPTAYQEGMVGPHWSKGWIIENCDIYESKCSGISLGKYYQPDNDNKWLKTKYKDGTQTERECICQAVNDGWSKEKTGSHIIRNCNIHHCGQTGIVGHMGGVFSIIENNHIHHINNKQNLAGAEIGGIKMHAAIDVIIRNNTFDHCTRGLWLDWQAQGTRVTGNLFFDNCLPDDYNLTEGNTVGEDIFIEVSHGPTLIDNNYLLSDCALKLPTQGCAFVKNIIAGSITTVGRGVNNGTIKIPSPRYTPYHVPHSTAIAGFMTILHGDMRFYNNVFVQKPVRSGLAKMLEPFKDDDWLDDNLICGTIPYNEYPDWEEYKKQFEGYCGMGSPASDRYYDHLPIWADNNAYFNGAKPMEREQAYIDNEHKIILNIIKQDGKYEVESNVWEYLPDYIFSPVSSDILGYAFEPEQKFESPAGESIIL